MERELDIRKFTIISSLYDYGNFTFPNVIEATVEFTGKVYAINTAGSIKDNDVILIRQPEAQVHPYHLGEFISELISFGMSRNNPIILETYSDEFIKLMELNLIALGLTNELSVYIRLGAEDLLNGRENTQIIDVLYENLATPVTLINSKYTEINK